jgi:hypothetical protein
MRSATASVIALLFLAGCNHENKPTKDFKVPPGLVELGSTPGKSCTWLGGAKIPSNTVSCQVCAATPEGGARYAAVQCRDGATKYMESCGLKCTTRAGKVCYVYGPGHDRNWTKILYEGQSGCYGIGQDAEHKEVYLYGTCQGTEFIQKDTVYGDDPRCVIKYDHWTP